MSAEPRAHPARPAVFARGARFELGECLGVGASGEVFSVTTFDGLAVKLYREPTADREEQLRVLMSHPPADGPDHRSFAWPRDVVTDGQRRFAGFVMGRVDRTTGISIGALLEGKRPLHFTWRDLLDVAANLSSAVAAVHEVGGVLGQLRPSKVLLTGSTMVTLVDCDSIQVPDRPTAAAEQVRDLEQLAQLVRELLVFGGDANVLPSGLGQMIAGPAELSAALHAASANLRACPARPTHYFAPHLPACPWCVMAASGQPDPFALDAEPAKRGRRRWPGIVAATAMAALAASLVTVQDNNRVAMRGGAAANPAATTAAPTTTSGFSTVLKQGPTSARGGGNPLPHQDDFSMARGWSERADDHAATKVAGGELQVALAARSGVELVVPGLADLRGNVRIEVDVVDIGKDVKAALVCRSRSGKYQYRAEVDGRGWWLLIPTINEVGVTNMPLLQASSPDQFTRAWRNPGPNRVALECIGDDQPGRPLMLRLTVNGQLVAETDVAAAFGPGTVAIAAMAGAEPGEVRFDNVEVRAI